MTRTAAALGSATDSRHHPRARERRVTLCRAVGCILRRPVRLYDCGDRHFGRVHMPALISPPPTRGPIICLIGGMIYQPWLKMGDRYICCGRLDGDPDCLVCSSDTRRRPRPEMVAEAGGTVNLPNIIRGIWNR